MTDPPAPPVVSGGTLPIKSDKSGTRAVNTRNFQTFHVVDFSFLNF